MPEKKLYIHIPHLHTPRNPNSVHAEERSRSHLYRRFNDGAAVWTTRIFSTMELFWLLNLFLLTWMIGNSVGIWHFDPMPFPLLLFLWNIPQLPLLPLLAIGQSILGRKQEIMAEEQFNTTMKTYHDIEQVMLHLDAQDEKILAILARLEGKR